MCVCVCVCVCVISSKLSPCGDSLLKHLLGFLCQITPVHHWWKWPKLPGCKCVCWPIFCVYLCICVCVWSKVLLYTYTWLYYLKQNLVRHSLFLKKILLLSSRWATAMFGWDGRRRGEMFTSSDTILNFHYIKLIFDIIDDQHFFSRSHSMYLHSVNTSLLKQWMLLWVGNITWYREIRSVHHYLINSAGVPWRGLYSEAATANTTF